MKSRTAGAPALFLVLVAMVSDADAQTISDGNFSLELVHRGRGMVPLVFGADGDLYVGEKTGSVLLFRRTPGSLSQYDSPRRVVTLSSVGADGERGLMGLALHPSFPSSPWLYAFYSAGGDQRLVRVRLNSTLDAASGSPEILLSGLPNARSNHNAGDIAFHPIDRTLYVALGDDAMAEFAPDLDHYHGKILRLDERGRGLSSNPFFDGSTSSVRSRIWGIGARNPFRFAFHPRTSELYVSENGLRADRVSLWSAPGTDGGWPEEFDAPSDPRIRNLIIRSPSITAIELVDSGPFADPAFPEAAVLYLANHRLGTIERWRLVGEDRGRGHR